MFLESHNVVAPIHLQDRIPHGKVNKLIYRKEVGGYWVRVDIEEHVDPLVRKVEKCFYY